MKILTKWLPLPILNIFPGLIHAFNLNYNEIIKSNSQLFVFTLLNYLEYLFSVSFVISVKKKDFVSVPTFGQICYSLSYKTT